ncbi:MAG TPA: hypothetical protein VFZ16_22950 [Hyphomicrobiaceae bacterium]|nr:hypothetical protein [Hyphomicrobiaceae bacterium]
MNVIPLERARARLRAPRRIEPPSALSPVRIIAPSRIADDEEEDRLRMRQNLAAFLVIIAIVTAGSWLMANLQRTSQLRACLEAGHRNCLQAQHLTSPYRR